MASPALHCFQRTVLQQGNRLRWPASAKDDRPARQDNRKLHTAQRLLPARETPPGSDQHTRHSRTVPLPEARRIEERIAGLDVAVVVLRIANEVLGMHMLADDGDTAVRRAVDAEEATDRERWRTPRWRQCETVVPEGKEKKVLRAWLHSALRVGGGA